MDWQKLCNDIPFGLLNFSPGITVALAEKATILHQLRHFQGNKTQAAIACGIALSTMDRKLEQYREEILERELKMKQVQDYEKEVQRRLRGLPPGADVEQPYTFTQGQGLQYQNAKIPTPGQEKKAVIEQEVNDAPPELLTKKKRGRHKKALAMNAAARKAMES